MKFWDMITGNDITKKMKAFESRAQELPEDFKAVWEKIKLNLWPHSSLSGKNLIQPFEDALSLLEEAAANGQRAAEVLNDDLKGFCEALTADGKSSHYRDKWRKRLNKNIAKKLAKLNK